MVEKSVELKLSMQKDKDLKESLDTIESAKIEFLSHENKLSPKERNEERLSISDVYSTALFNMRNEKVNLIEENNEKLLDLTEEVKTLFNSNKNISEQLNANLALYWRHLETKSLER